MAFDAGMLSCIAHEIEKTASGGRIEKIYQPEKDIILIQLRTLTGGKKLLINTGSGNPRISFTNIQRENPMQAPMLCMLLRKHLTGAILCEIRQPGFERVLILGFDTRDEMGYECRKYLIAEIMGKYSNLIFADENMKIISATRTVDFSTSSLRQILPGMKYELPPAQDKKNPLVSSREEFDRLYAKFPAQRQVDKFITSAYLGISSSNAREISYLATGKSDSLICECTPQRLWESFLFLTGSIKENKYSPCVVFEGNNPVEYSFIPLTHYPDNFEIRYTESPSDALDMFFENRDRESRIKQRAADLFKILTHAESRIIKKLELQRQELSECEKSSVYKKYGDLITSNIYLITKGQKTAEITDYEKYDPETGEYGKCVIELDERMSASANAQKYYKKYAKAKNAKAELTKQIKIGEEELEYIYSVFDSLSKAETDADLSQIRDELYRSGYASKMKGYVSPKKQSAPSVLEFMTTNGYKVLCGKNNIQNEYITFKCAEKHDYWFHAKNVPGSHVLMLTGGKEPPEQDFTDACEIAAYYSKANGGVNIPVDYLLAKGVKKAAGAKPGFVIYHSNWSAYVTPDEEKIRKMRYK